VQAIVLDSALFTVTSSIIFSLSSKGLKRLCRLHSDAPEAPTSKTLGDDQRWVGIRRATGCRRPAAVSTHRDLRSAAHLSYLRQARRSSGEIAMIGGGGE